MKSRNLLDELSRGALSLEQADEILTSVLRSPQGASTASILGFSKAEWTANSQGAFLSEIALWRESGLPKNCVNCGLEINVDRFGWLIKDVDGESRLEHVRFPAK